MSGDNILNYYVLFSTIDNNMFFKKILDLFVSYFKV